MEQCYSPKLFVSNDTDQLPLVQTLRAFKQAYEPIHGYLCLLICGFGVITNVIHIFVLTSKNMRNSAVNVILTAIAVCDAGTMLSYLVYLIHFVLGPKDYCGTFMSWGWMCFLMIHISVSIAMHTSSLWLAVGMAFIRLMTLRQGSLSSGWQKSEAAWKLSFSVYVTVIILCIPTIVAHQILEFDRDMFIIMIFFAFDLWHSLCQTNVSRSVYLNDTSYSIFTIGISQLALVDDCSMYKANLWLTGIMFKVIPSIFLVFLSTSLLIRISEAERNRRRLLGSKINYLPSTVSSGGCDNNDKGKKKPNNIKKKRRRRTMDHTTVMLISILLVFLLTELPQGFIAILNAVYLRDVSKYIYKSLDDFMDLLSLINASVNFVLYCVMSSRYRQTFWKVILPRKAYLSMFIRGKCGGASGGGGRTTTIAGGGGGHNNDNGVGTTRDYGVGADHSGTFLSSVTQRANSHKLRKSGSVRDSRRAGQHNKRCEPQRISGSDLSSRIAYLTNKNPSLFPKQNKRLSLQINIPPCITEVVSAAAAVSRTEDKYPIFVGGSLPADKNDPTNKISSRRRLAKVDETTADESQQLLLLDEDDFIISSTNHLQKIGPNDNKNNDRNKMAHQSVRGPVSKSLRWPPKPFRFRRKEANNPRKSRRRKSGQRSLRLISNKSKSTATESKESSSLINNKPGQQTPSCSAALLMDTDTDKNSIGELQKLDTDALVVVNNKFRNPDSDDFPSSSTTPHSITNNNCCRSNTTITSSSITGCIPILKTTTLITLPPVTSSSFPGGDDLRAGGGDDILISREYFLDSPTMMNGGNDFSAAKIGQKTFPIPMNIGSFGMRNARQQSTDLSEHRSTCEHLLMTECVPLTGQEEEEEEEDLEENEEEVIML